MEYEFTKRDLISAFENDLKKPKLLGFFLAYMAFNFIFMFFGGLMVLLYILNAPAPIFLLSVIALLTVVILLAMFFSRRGRATRIVRGRLRRGEIELQYFGRHRLKLKEDSMELQYGTICVQRLYAGIQKIAEYSGGILVYNSQLSRDIIPYTAFRDIRQREEFINHLQARISLAKNVGISNQSVEKHKQDAYYVLEYIWDEPGFITATVRAGRMLYTTRLGWSVGRIICTLIGLFLCLTSIRYFIRVFTATIEFVGPDTIMFGIICFVFGICLLLPLLVVFTPWMKMLYRKQIDNGVIPRDCIGSQMLCFKEDRMTVLRRLNSFDVVYGNVYRIRHEADGMYMLLKGRTVIVIPNTAFSTDNQKHELANYIANKIKGKEKTKN